MHIDDIASKDMASKDIANKDMAIEDMAIGNKTQTFLPYVTNMHRVKLVNCYLWRILGCN